jgi:hypothetical protein
MPWAPARLASASEEPGREKDVPITGFRSMGRWSSLSTPRFYLVLLFCFAARAGSGCGGLYAAISYSVSQRTHEMGFGACVPKDLLKLSTGMTSAIGVASERSVDAHTFLTNCLRRERPSFNLAALLFILAGLLTCDPAREQPESIRSRRCGMSSGRVGGWWLVVTGNCHRTRVGTKTYWCSKTASVGETSVCAN